MSLRHFYRPNWVSGDPAVEFTDSVRLYTFDMIEQAEEGSVGTSSMIVDDPLGALDFPPLTRIWSVETEVASSSNTYVHHGYIAERTVRRGDSALTRSARIWEISVVDENSILSRRVLSSADANRPAETDVQRVTWLANVADGQGLIDDTTFLSTANPVNMDAVDYRGQTALEVLNDCAEASGKNFYAYFNQNAGSALWYGAQDLTVHNSMIRLTNDLSDIPDPNNLGTTFPLYDKFDTKLERNPSRMLSSVYYQWANGATYVRNPTMFNRIGLRDAPMSSFNVKTVNRAEARANRLLADLDTEEDRITCAVLLPASKVTWIKAGMRLQFKATHFPGYESFVWLRVLSCAVAFNSEDPTYSSYKLTLVLGTDSIPADPIPNTFPASAIMYLPAGDGGAAEFGIEPEVRWQGTGDDPPPGGFPTVPLVGSLEYVSDGLVATYPYKGVRALGSGSLTVTFTADDVAGVVGTVNCVPSICKNGSIVASSPHQTTDILAPGFPYGHSSAWNFSTTISVVAGDVISAQFTSTWPNMKVPAGTGGSLKLLISGNLT